MGDIAVILDGTKVLSPSVASISAQMFASPERRTLPLDHYAGEYVIQALAVMDVGPGHDERQRDATAVHQQVALAPLFFPDPSGLDRRTPEPRAPSSSSRRHSASAKRCLPSGHTRPSQLSTDLRRNPPLPIRGIVCGRRLRCQSAPWEEPSTGSRCAVRRRWPRKPVLLASVAGRHLACVCRSCPQPTARESAVPPAARIHQ
jgi:hypothetical protein